MSLVSIPMEKSPLNVTSQIQVQHGRIQKYLVAGSGRVDLAVGSADGVVADSTLMTQYVMLIKFTLP